MRSYITAAISAAAAKATQTTEFLKVDNLEFTFAGKDVFLSGANQAWINYGYDFGNDQSQSERCGLQDYINAVSDAGGNSIRMWVFVEGESIPAFDDDGYVTGTDSKDSLISDLKTYI